MASCRFHTPWQHHPSRSKVYRCEFPLSFNAPPLVLLLLFWWLARCHGCLHCIVHAVFRQSVCVLDSWHGAALFQRRAFVAQLLMAAEPLLYPRPRSLIQQPILLSYLPNPSQPLFVTSPCVRVCMCGTLLLHITTHMVHMHRTHATSHGTQTNRSCACFVPFPFVCSTPSFLLLFWMWPKSQDL